MTNKHEEIDLFYVFDKIRDFYHGMLANFYRFVQFLKRNWLILLVIIVGGYFAGKFWQSFNRPKKEAILIVQNNFDSSNYVYNAVEMLARKSGQEDTIFLKKIGINHEVTTILEISIEPVVNIMDLMDKTLPSDRNLDTYLAQVDIEEDLLTSELYYPEYKYHKLTLRLQTSDKKIIEKIVNYLNSDDKFNQIKAIQVAETQLHVQRNEKSIESIDGILAANTISNQEVKSPTDIYLNTSMNNNLHQLVEKKNELIEENKMLKSELVKYDQVVTVINDPQLYFTDDFFDAKKILLPAFLLFVFVAYIVLRGLYKKGRKYAE